MSAESVRSVKSKYRYEPTGRGEFVVYHDEVITTVNSTVLGHAANLSDAIALADAHKARTQETGE